MTKSVDYYFSLSSPYSNMGHRRFLDLAARAGATVNFKPCNVGAVFAVSGGLPMKKRAPQRIAYRMMELKRWRDHLGMPINVEPKYFPVETKPATLFAIAASAAAQDKAKVMGDICAALMSAVWLEERDISDEATILAIAEEQGLDGPAHLSASKAPDIEAIYDANTEDAIAAQVFGAPTYIYNGELFWGQDRLEFLERALKL
ncbi:MAG: 2-hydroxychromene-2-carboxylate isomerase [Proteobacteria bacterium]|nr:2-hydroxychromene-2-carboxylate isomerase [Pseudomonadota bacterium]